jgi:predicted nucleic acid-binding protein
VIVVDASVLVTALVLDDGDGDLARQRLRDELLAAPELVDLEVASVLRRLQLNSKLAVGRAELALTDLAALPMERAPHRPLLFRCWSLRKNLTVYDAAYVALAEALAATLLTADAALARSARRTCSVELLPLT